MDPTLNGGPPDGVDISYLLSALGKKLRFLGTNHSDMVVVNDFSELTLSVDVFNELSMPATTSQTVVKFEIGTALNAAVPSRLGQMSPPLETASRSRQSTLDPASTP
jgi:hypothetical protein